MQLSRALFFKIVRVCQLNKSICRLLWQETPINGLLVASRVKKLKKSKFWPIVK